MKRKRAAHHPLTRWRFEYGLTISAAAKEFGCTQGYLSEIENRKKVPSLTFASNVVRITKGDVQFSDLVCNRSKA